MLERGEIRHSLGAAETSPTFSDRPSSGIVRLTSISLVLRPSHRNIPSNHKYLRPTMSDGGYGGLPYGGTPPPPPSSPPTNGVPTALDRPLSDYPLQPDVPEHVKSLMGRMSRGKVYLLEESTGILHAEGGNRIRGDPVCPLKFGWSKLRAEKAIGRGSPRLLRCWMRRIRRPGSAGFPLWSEV